MTQQLPPALAPWGRHLAMFPLDLAVEIGAIVRRLASALGPPISTRHRGDDPDGFDGIVRTGPYDRMLHSEWLLADEMPDEFLRRAVMREHLFFRIARRSPLDELTSVALFDAGPSQIGGPRLLHLALLIVLARRCAERNGTLRWAVLQEEPRRVYERVDADAVHDLLRLRNAREVTEADLDAWIDLLPHGDRRHRETWMIGGERLARLVGIHAHRGAGTSDFREVSIVSIEETLDITSREVSVRVRDARGDQRRLTLQLPEERQAIRLLRSPFDPLPAPVAAARSVESSGAMFFAAEGKRILARAPNGGIYVYIVQHGNVVSVKEYQARRGELVIAAGWRANGGVSIALVDWRKTRIRVGTLHRQEEGSLLDTNGMCAWNQSDRLSPIAMAPASDFNVLFLDGMGVCWITSVSEGRVLRILDNIAAIMTFERQPYLAKYNGEWQIIRIDGTSPSVIARFEGTGTHACFGTPTADSGEAGPLIALEQSPGQWLASGSSVRNYACPPNARVLGITALRSTSGPALVVAESHAISLLAGTTMRLIHRTPNPITAAACDTSGPHVAYVSAGRLNIVSLEANSKRNR